ncbi:kinase, putative [Ricinus communis]|uniref:RING-type E3 ubiquitin transferase n=1 Tax=Ricinus communis TaxID=3988 RepID=B9S5V0_RICCO|nr:kinase, putative [Ricinus communis]
MALFHSEPKADEAHGATVIAIDCDKNSKCAVKWAIDNLVNNKKPNCILVHVQCKTLHPGHIPKEGRPPTQQELQQFFLPYRGYCARRGIETKNVVLHDIDVPSALTNYVVLNKASNIVLGASRRNALTRKFKNPDAPSTLLKSAPESCAVYVISKGKLQTLRPASRPLTASDSTSSNISSDSSQQHHSPPATTNNASSTRQHNHLEVPQSSSIPPSELHRKSDETFPDRGSDSMHRAEHEYYEFSSKTHSPAPSIDDHSSDLLHRDSISDGNEISSGPISIRSADMSYENVDFSPKSGSLKNPNSSQLAVNAEMRRLKLELQHSMQLFRTVTNETVLAKQMVMELHRLESLESQKSEESKLAERAALTLAEMEKHKKKVASEAVQAVKKLADLEAQKRNAEMRAQRKKNMETMANDDFRCRRYTIDEIEVATQHFAPSHKIGEGAYGPVFRGMLNHIAVAIKILRPDLSQGLKQFRQEVDVLSSLRHPHMVILLGACPEYGCLVYEYMENGNLEDRLFRKDNTLPIPWRTRFKIAYEIAAALLFLHETKPEPLVHRDLKPANILLDRNYVSKISDVGLARLVPPSAANNVSQYRMTAAAGTFYYIDPEYQQTGLLGVKSDLYSFGVVLLQLLTAKPPMGLSCQVEDSIQNGTFSDVLDPALTDWPVEDCLSLAKIGVKCCELRKKDRPNLANVILPELERLTDLAMANEAIEPETTIPLTSPIDLISEAQRYSSEIISKRRRQQQFKSMSKRWIFKNSPGKSSTNDQPPLPSSPSGKSDMISFQGCWSPFVSCISVHDPPTHR